MEKKYFIGIGFTLFDARGILLAEDGQIVLSVEKKRKKINANEAIELLLDLFEEVFRKAEKYRANIQGVGVAFGGIVNSKKGVVYWPQKVDSTYTYISLPFKEYLEKKYGLPVFLENDANACAVAEFLINYPRYKNLIYMFSGVGSGLIINGKLHRGRDGGAGELFLNAKVAMQSHLGDFSFLRQWPIDLDLVRRTKETITLGKETTLIKKISSTGELSVKDIFEEAKKKDRVAREIVKEAAFCLGVKIAFLVNLLNPEIIIIGGGLEEAGEVFLEPCIATVKSLAFSEMTRNIKIVFSQLGVTTAALGAALICKEKSLQE